MKAIKFFKSFGKVISTTRDSVGSSTDFIDDILEQEYLIKGAETIKNATGKVISTGGSTYQKSKDALEKLADKLEKVKGTIDKSSFRKKTGQDKLKAPSHVKDISQRDHKPVGEIIEISRKVNRDTENLLDEIKRNLKK